MALNFNQFANEANAFMADYAKQLNIEENTDKAGRILSSILHGLREVISTEESLQLIAQFPMFLKAVYVNGWTIHKRNRIKNVVDLIDIIRKFDGNTSLYDFESDEVAEQYIIKTFIALRKYVSLGELEDIRTELPKDLKSLIYHNIMF